MNKFILYKVLVVGMLCSIGSYSSAAVFGFKRIAITPVGCVSDASGSISIEVINPGNSVKYTIEGVTTDFFKEQENNGVFENLPIDTYEITVSTVSNDATVKQIDASVSVLKLAPLTILTTIIHPVTVRGGRNGSISIGVQGGKGPYTYVLSSNGTTIRSTSPNFNNLPAGLYSISVLGNPDEDCPADTVTVQVVEPGLGKEKRKKKHKMFRKKRSV